MNVVIANDLANGLVVFLAEEGWTLEIDRASLLETQEASDAALARAQKDAADNVVVEPTLIEVRRDGAHLVPVKLRERIRAAGPTTGHSLPAAAQGPRGCAA